MSDRSPQHPDDARSQSEARSRQADQPPAPAPRPRPFAGFAIPRFRSKDEPQQGVPSLRTAPTRPQSRPRPGTAGDASDVGTSERPFAPPDARPYPPVAEAQARPRTAPAARLPSDVGTSSRPGPTVAPGRAPDVGTRPVAYAPDYESPFPEFAPDPTSSPDERLDVGTSARAANAGAGMPERRPGGHAPSFDLGRAAHLQQRHPGEARGRPDRDADGRQPQRHPYPDHRLPDREAAERARAERTPAEVEAVPQRSRPDGTAAAVRSHPDDDAAIEALTSVPAGAVDVPGPVDAMDLSPLSALGLGGKPKETLDDFLKAAKKEMVDRNRERSRSRDVPEDRLGTETTERSETTKLHYLASAERLKKKFAREKRLQADEIDPHAFALWFASLRSDVSPSTWRVYKQGALVALDGMEDEEKVTQAREIIESEGKYDFEMDPVQKETAEPTRKTITSANKARYFALDDLDQLEAHLRLNSRTDAALDLLDWLRAGIATGLRPVEWTHSEVRTFEDNGSKRGHRTYLFVLNAKATNGRANGTARTIDITDFTEDMQRTVERISKKAVDWQRKGEYRTVQYKCTNLLYRAGNKLWPRRKKSHYTLYSCRHQFTLNMKALGLDEVEIASLLGHSVTKTQNTHYGQRSKGWSPDKIIDRPRGVADEIGTVRYVEDLSLERERMRKRALGRNPDQIPEADAPETAAPGFGERPVRDFESIPTGEI